MDRLDLLRIFVRVVDCNSFTRAADMLGLPRSSVSTAVQTLEQRVGARLLHRTTRRVSPTQDGGAFYHRCQQLIADFEEAEALFRGAPARLSGAIKVDAPGRLGRLVIAPALPEFLDRHPDVEIELGVTDRRVDLVEEGVDCAIRAGDLAESGLVARRIGALDLVNCASPAYIARRGAPENLVDLERHFAVRYASPSTGRVEGWEWLDRGAPRTLPMRGRVTVNSAEAYIACCLAGLGLIQAPAYDVRGHIERGELVEVLPAHRAAPMDLTLLYPTRRHLSRRLQAFMDWVTELLAREARV